MKSSQDCISPSTRRYRCEGYHECVGVFEQEFERMEREEDIDERSFLECFENSGDKLLMLSWKSYDHVSLSSLIKMPSTAHGTAASEFSIIVRDWLRQSGAHITISTSKSVRGSTKTKVADFAWMPYDLPPGRSMKWPTVAGEVVVTQSRRGLTQAMKFWLDEPESEVRVAISITASKRKVLVERWVRRPNGPTSPDQWMGIVRNPRKNCPRISGYLSINFSDIMLRPRGNGQTDFVLTPQALDDLAKVIWRDFLG
ncbi:Pc13g14560 [Penicillium rubens Wisconsin 54-1255]|uniref:Pc13g14560 protein n=2 Tax=Penicillium rubens TaxID=1108849 RepID=B6H2H9_PENRW|nr:Pc13g14560 [Penicillium rubens Wisconsin 54-1255]